MAIEPPSPYAPVRPGKYCRACNRLIDAEAMMCTGCGVMQVMPRLDSSEKKILPTLALCVLFGVFGFHRFYAGKWKTGILQLVTLGGLGMWMLWDMLMIILGEFSDARGEKMTEWL